MIKRLSIVLSIAFCFLTILPAQHPASAKDTWTSVRSNNFFLVGNANEKEIRQVATRLEQFRDVFSRLFPGMNFRSPVPTTVIVFKNDSSYTPYKPKADGKTVAVAGYFQPGREINYITLTTENRGGDTYSTIFHEYVHLLVNNTLGKTTVPPWFNEGIAEYYSTFDIEDDRKVYLGNLIHYHLELLRTSELFPLDQLFAVDYASLERNKHDARGLFYAQSWALVHYLIQGNEGKRLPQLSAFVNLLNKNAKLETAFRDAFQTDYAGMMKEFKDYLKRRTYRGQVATFERKLEFDAEMKVAPVSEAEALGYLGDLLYHIHRPEDAKVKLDQAVALNPRLAMARATLGMLFADEKKFKESRDQLEQAVADDSTSYLAHYYYAYVLSRELMPEGQRVYGFPDETAKLMRKELRRAIQLKPDFPESYNLLAFVNLVSGEELDESIQLIKTAVRLSPGSEDFLFVLAQLYMRKQDFDNARKVVEPLAASGADAEIRANAQSLLATISSIQEEMSRVRDGGNQPTLKSAQPTLRQTVVTTDQSVVVENTDPGAALRESLRKPAEGETQVAATLVRIDCNARGITFTVKVGERLIKLKSASFDQVEITTFSPDVSGEITCGPRKPQNNVVVVYLPMSDARTQTEGSIRSLEFVPKDFLLKN